MKISSKPLPDGYHEIYRFPNGYGASVINHESSQGLELAPIHWENSEKFHIAYDTSVPNGFLWYLTQEKVEALLVEIANLPRRKR